jgi:hypothetical protein
MDIVWAIHIIRVPEDANPVVDQDIIDEFHADPVAWGNKYGQLYPHEQGQINQLVADLA